MTASAAILEHERPKAGLGVGRQPTAEDERAWSGRTRSPLGLMVFFLLFRFAGPFFAYLLLYPVALWNVFFAGEHARASRDYLSRRFPGSGTLRLRWLCFRHFLSFGRILIDRGYAFTNQLHRLRFERSGVENLSEALAAGKGLIILSAHLGNWELAGYTLKRAGISAEGTPVNVVMLQADGERARRVLSAMSGKPPYNIIESNDPLAASIEIVAALRRGEVVAIQGDRVMDGGGAVVNFIGGKARFPVSAFVLAVMSGAPLLTVLTNRDGNRRYSIEVTRPRYYRFHSRASREQDLHRWAQEFATLLETKLQRYPFQWHNFYRFWQS